MLDRVGIGAERRLQLRKFSKGMVQRVGIAQALINDPEVIFFDEPMSGLDPLGRREVRSLILELRDQGRTVFFSSHILADAEALCSRVAVVAGGRLAATGRLNDILAFEVRGWELVMTDVTPAVLARLAPAARRTTEISPGRYAIELRDRQSAGARPRRSHRDGRQARLAQSGAGYARGLSSSGRWPRPVRPGRSRWRLRVRAIRCIAVSVFRESVRDRVPYNLVLFAILLIAASFFLGQLTAGQDVKIIKDLGLAAIAIFGLFIAIFIGIGLVSKEVERRSIYALLSKPISRPQLILGKYAGLVLTLAVNVAVMTAALYAVLTYMTSDDAPSSRPPGTRPGIDPALFKALFLIFVELMLITALALFFSTFSTPLLSAALTFGFYIVGHFNADLRNFEQVVDSKTVRLAGARPLSRAAGSVGVRRQDRRSFTASPVPAGYLALTVGYGGLLHRAPADRRDAHLLAAGFQVTDPSDARSR